MKYNFLKGSEWRKWDLQVQPAETNWYLNFNPDDSRIKSRIKEFITNAIGRGISVIGITDHNFGGSIDIALKIIEEENLDIIILPGVELNTQEGWHVLIYFNPEWKNKNNFNTWCDAIRNFLSICGVANPYDESGNIPIGITTKELIKKLNTEDMGLLFFSHCLSKKGFFKRGNNTSRKEIMKLSLDEGYLFGFDIKNNSIHEVENEIKDVLSDNNYKIHLPVISSSDAESPTNVGSFFTWIKAEPTYEGLKQILFEPQERVFIGEEPEIVQRVRENKTKFIKTLRIDKVQGYRGDKGIWFENIEIPINPGLVAIIGNKGMGKSALTDIIGLCGNSHNYKDFSFLKEDRFKKHNLAENFEAELEWESGERIRKILNEQTDVNSPERVRYFPQNFFEQLTNNLDAYEFEKELEKIIFSYIPEEEKLGEPTFEGLINLKKSSIEKNINNIKQEIAEINKKIIELENKKHPDYLKKLEELLKIKERELEEHEKNKPKEIPDPSKDALLSGEMRQKGERLKKLNQDYEEITKNTKDKMKKKESIYKEIHEIENIKNELNILEHQIELFIKKSKDAFAKYNLDINQIFKYEINYGEMDRLLNVRKELINTIEKELESLQKKGNKIKEETESLKSQLTEPQRLYQKYLEELKRWEEKKKEIEGNENIPYSLEWFKKEIDYIKTSLPNDLNELKNKRFEYVKMIYEGKCGLLNIFKKLKSSIEEKISEFRDKLGEYEINIDVSFHIKPDFYDEFLKYINQRVKGSFYGVEEGKSFLINLVGNKTFDNFDDLKNLLESIINSLEEDKRERFKGETRYIQDQILNKEKWLDFYNFLFSIDYLQPRYELKLGNKNIKILSPGEKGALLVVFYLLLDKENIPLIIDQPEENLDNESIYKILSYFVRHAKKNRQVIIVTHNPNLAIVGDAEQIIYVHIDKVNGNKFSFEAGSIENPKINKHASDILEGTLKAFDLRRLKYIKR